MAEEADPKIVKLIQHARKITGDMMKFAIEMTEDKKEQAQKTLEYGKKVKDSVEKLIFQKLSGTFEGQDLFTVIYVSILPQMENAINDLNFALIEKPKEEEPEEEIPTQEELDAMIMENFKRFQLEIPQELASEKQEKEEKEEK